MRGGVFQVLREFGNALSFLHLLDAALVLEDLNQASILAPFVGLHLTDSQARPVCCFVDLCGFRLPTSFFFL